MKYEDIKAFIEEEGYLLNSKEYVNSNTKLNLACPKGHIYDATFSKFKTGRRCPHCSNRVKIQKEDVLAHLKDDGYELLGEFVNSNIRTELRCPNGHTWITNYQEYKNGRRCSKCSDRYVENKKLPTRWNTDMVREILSKDGYKLIGDYKNATTHIKIVCPEGHEALKYFGHFLKGHMCQKCVISPENEARRERSSNEFLSMSNDSGYTILEEYYNSSVPILMRCKNGHYTRKSLSNFKKSDKCKGCLMSRYEEMVYKELKDKYRFIVHEYVHPDLSSQSFDLAIFSSEKFDDIEFIIEVDGQQHFIDNAFGIEGSLEINQNRDREKDNFCKNNNIKLVRISYKELEDGIEWHNKLR